MFLEALKDMSDELTILKLFLLHQLVPDVKNLNEKKDTFLDSLRSPVIFKHLVIMILVW